MALTFATHDIVSDSPTNNFATLNPLTEIGTGDVDSTLTDGNLKSVSTDNAAFRISTLGVLSGKWYFEAITSGVTNNSDGIGFGNSLDNYTLYRNNGHKLVDGSDTDITGDTWTLNNEVAGVCIDMANGQVEVFVSGVSQGVIDTLDVSDYIFFIVYNRLSGTVSVNFGQDPTFGGTKTSGSADASDVNGIGSFYYQPPTGALALCTANLPEMTPTVDDDVPQDYFKAVKYVGNGAATSTGASNTISIGMPADLIWIKERDSTSVNHHIVDTVRGIGTGRYNSLASNNDNQQTNSEVYSGVTGGVTYIDHTNNEFTVHGRTGWVGGDVNEPSKNYIAWCWKAGKSPSGSTSTTGSAKRINTSGTQDDTSCSALATAATNAGASNVITPTLMSINQAAGFSIVMYTGAGANATVPHGLSQTLDALIVKSSTGDGSAWRVWFKGFSVNEYLVLNSDTNKKTQATPAVWSANPTSSVFSVGTSGDTNWSSRDYIAYCWHSVEGCSKFGSYTGNGSADGPFVYCGFRPAFLLRKNITNGGTGYDWVLIDNARSSYNLSNNKLYPNLSNLENVNSDNSDTGDNSSVDLLSNGFKVRAGNARMNGSNQTYIYMAFAEQPFKFSNAR